MATPLRPTDPRVLGGYQLEAVLGEGGQGIVYLGNGPGGDRVAIKWLRPELAADQDMVRRFLHEVSAAKRVAPFCTAQVLDVGAEDARPYIVSEYIEGESLAQAIPRSGPRTGNSLHRLAIGTATALAAIHQAGIVHRDFKPPNVILGSDGPRVIDFGISKALGSHTALTSTMIGTPAYMAPEQLVGGPIGPAADLFAWAGTIAYAANGRAPFGNDTMPAVINRVLRMQPDLGQIPQPLRGILLDCLNKNPALRPSARQVIDRLLVSDPATARVTVPQPPVPRRKFPTLAVVTGATALAVIAAIGGVWAATSNSEPPLVRKTSAPPVTPSASPEPVVIDMDDTTAVARELPADPAYLSIFWVKREKWDAYVREPGKTTFTRHSYADAAPSPTGDRLAGIPWEYDDEDFDTLKITQVSSGTSATVKTVTKPLTTNYVHWSPDGTKILLTALKKTGETTITQGFVVVDPAAETAEIIRVPGLKSDTAFAWTGTGDSVTTVVDQTPHVYDLLGKEQRTLPVIGGTLADPRDMFTDGGGSFIARCEGKDVTLCVWDTATGTVLSEFESGCDTVLGWWDATHIYCTAVADDDEDAVVVSDLEGVETQTLIRATDTAMDKLYFRSSYLHRS
ncbi:serine/threonine protein kinase [Herbidospora mongoliensis]|uniref:serine/threonine protein kinase n=1 Tax=Herbidospora mongoliensis TaxID=688067 RepID=UPI00082D402F|nr:serine/threonine-protein kinase [Herbidospora mongoliensis]